MSSGHVTMFISGGVPPPPPEISLKNYFMEIVVVVVTLTYVQTLKQKQISNTQKRSVRDMSQISLKKYTTEKRHVLLRSVQKVRCRCKSDSVNKLVHENWENLT